MPQAAKGISILREDSESVSYRINCECTDENHSLDAYVETDTDDDFVVLTFFTESSTEKPVSLWHRLVIAYNVLLKGQYSTNHEIILDEQATLNFLQSVGESVDRMRSK